MVLPCLTGFVGFWGLKFTVSEFRVESQRVGFGG